MAKKKRTLALSKTELVFEDNGVIAVEHLKDDTKQYDLVELLKEFDGCTNLNINISTEKEL